MTAPLLTVAIASRTGLPAARPLLAHLQHQTLAPRMVMVLVAPRGLVDLRELQSVHGFAEARLREVDRVETRGEAAGIALRETTTPFLMAHEFHTRGRLAGVRPRTAWVQAITDQLPGELA